MGFVLKFKHFFCGRKDIKRKTKIGVVVSWDDLVGAMFHGI